MIPWLSSIESTYRPEPEQVAQRITPFSWQSRQGGLLPISLLFKDKPIGFSIISSGMDLS